MVSRKSITQDQSQTPKQSSKTQAESLEDYYFDMEAAEIRGIQRYYATATKKQMEDDDRVTREVFRELGIDDDD